METTEPKPGASQPTRRGRAALWAGVSVGVMALVCAALLLRPRCQEWEERRRLVALLERPEGAARSEAERLFVRHNLIRVRETDRMKGKSKSWVTGALGRPHAELSVQAAKEKEPFGSFLRNHPRLLRQSGEIWHYPDGPFMVLFDSNGVVVDVRLLKG